MRIAMVDQLFNNNDPNNLANNVAEFSVSEISQAVKRTLEGAFGRVRVRGEVGRPNYHGSGHLYFTLKDADAAIDAVAWRGSVNTIKLRLEEGMEVIITGRISSYPKSSRYQIVVEDVELAGEGALLKLLEDRRRKLAAAGFFDQEQKNELPFLPEVVGVITSPTGAVIRDILNRLEDRFPRHVLLWPVPVQGDGAAKKIAEAIEGFNSIPTNGSIPKPDILIVARGGGSLEDLWQFNDELVVRAAFASDIPLISAVGHETDTTLIDFAADCRASTPTAAAELSVPVRNELLAQVLDNGGRLVRGIGRFMEDGRTQLDGLSRGLPRSEALLDTAMQTLDFNSERLSQTIVHQIERANSGFVTASVSLRHPRHVIELKSKDFIQASRRLDANLRTCVRDLVMHFDTLSSAGRMIGGVNRTIQTAETNLNSTGQLLESVSFQRVLERGFALVRNKQGEAILSARATEQDQQITINFSDGVVPAVVKDGGLGKNGKKGKVLRAEKKKGSRENTGGQGSLF